MRPLDLILQAREALVAHRLRATLSVTGIICGVATIVAALAIGEGARRAALAEIAELGIANVFVDARADATRGEQHQGPVLTTADADALRATVAGVKVTAAERSIHAEVTTAGRHANLEVVGVTVDWLELMDVRVARGRWLSAEDLATRRRACIMGGEAARLLFGQADPVGQHVVANDHWCLIVGVLEEPRRSNSVLMPITAMDVRLGSADSGDHVHTIGIAATNADDVERIAVAAAALLSRRHPGQDATWRMVVPRELLRARLRQSRTSRMLVLALGGLALVISGVGIMNIMLASVAERTHEIGVRRAFGARRREIVAQFAAESALLCLAGGVAGLPLGALAALVVATAGEWPVAVTPGGIATALALAGVAGVAFGLYPACLAARLDPAVAINRGT